MFINRYTTPRHVWEQMKFGSRLAAGRVARPRGVIDVMFLFCDHFEGKALSLTREEVGRWVDQYPRLARRHRDADGRFPRHTWFYIYSDEADNVALLQMLGTLCEAGFGEIELHLHHGHGYYQGRPARNLFAEVESGPELRSLIRGAVRDFAKAGVLAGRAEGRPGRFGVIHGAWALDNSRWIPGYHGWCGVNNELDILRDSGCYADFTFPAWGTMQPARINSIYYVRDDPLRPKSYNVGVDLRVGRPAREELVIFEGPALGGSDISHANPPTPDRAANWIRSAVHVRGRPNWIFVKVHTHGCQDEETLDLLLGDGLDRFFSHLERTFGNGDPYRLHYVTAREAYNIARAAEAGMDGNPGDFRDFEIPACERARLALPV